MATVVPVQLVVRAEIAGSGIVVGAALTPDNSRAMAAGVMKDFILIYIAMWSVLSEVNDVLFW
jgi:ABC-type sugar transport system substrate-binding protein